MLQRQEYPLGSYCQVHRAADAAALASQRLPVGEVAVLSNLVRAHDRHVHIASPDDGERVCMVDDGRTLLQGDVLPTGVDQVDVLFAFCRQWPIADDPVLRLEQDVRVTEIVVGAEGGHAHSQIDHPTVLKLHSQAVAHGLSFQGLLLCCHALSVCLGLTCGSGLQSPRRSDTCLGLA